MGTVAFAFDAQLTLIKSRLLQAFYRSLTTAATSTSSATASTSSSSPSTSSQSRPATTSTRQSLADRLASGPDLDDFIAGNEDLVQAAAVGPQRVSMGNTTQ